MNEGHLQELMLEHAVPPPAPPGSSAVSLVRMGFPPRNPEAPGAAAFCGAWGQGGRGEGGMVRRSGVGVGGREEGLVRKLGLCACVFGGG